MQKNNWLNLLNIYNRLLFYISIIWNKYSSWIFIICLWIIFYLIGWLTLNRLCNFLLVLLLIWLYKILIQYWIIIVNYYIDTKVKKYGINSIYNWLCIFLQLNLYKNVILYILLQADYMACKFLIFINKRFFGNLLIYKMFNILVKHFTLLVGTQIIFFKIYSILIIWLKSSMQDIIIKRMYGIIFSILIFTDILKFIKSFIIAYPCIGPYSIILLIGLLYEIPFTSNLLNLYWQPYYIYQKRSSSTFIGIVTRSLYINYKQIVLYHDITLLMDFNHKYFDALLLDYAITKDCELKFEDILKFNGLQTLCFYDLFYYVDHPHVFSVIIYKYFLNLIMINVIHYYYFDIYIDQIKNKFNVNDLIKMEILKRNHFKALKLIIYLIWDMEYYLDNTFNPIENKSLRLESIQMDLITDIYKIELYGYKKFEKFNDLLFFILKKKDNEMEFFNINLNYSFYERVFYIHNFYGYPENVFYKNKTFELKYNLYNKVFTGINNNYENDTIVNYILENCEDVPNQRDSYYINNKINIFMNEWLMQRDNDLKESNYKRLKEVEDEMQLFMSHAI